MTKMPTIKDLKNVIGTNYNSVAWGNNRTVLNNQDTEVLAYGLGLGGFVCVFCNRGGKGFLMAYSYATAHPGFGSTYGGFKEVDIDKALEFIRKNSLVVHRAIDEKGLKEAQIRKKTKKPLVAKITYEEKSYGSNNLREWVIWRYKNGNFLIHNRQYYRGSERFWHTRYNHKQFLEAYESEFSKNVKSKNYYNVEYSEGFDKILEEIKMRATMEGI